MGLVERESSELPLTQQAELLSVSRSSFYYQPREPSVEELAINHRIDELYTQSPFYGSRKIGAQLRREGVLITRKTVQRHMREMGIVAVYPGAEPEPTATQRTRLSLSLTQSHDPRSQSCVGH